jgi:hypothetical protein
MVGLQFFFTAQGGDVFGNDIVRRLAMGTGCGDEQQKGSGQKNRSQGIHTTAFRMNDNRYSRIKDIISLIFHSV